jgi:hypothetical protein
LGSATWWDSRAIAAQSSKNEEGKSLPPGPSGPGWPVLLTL